MNSIIFSDFRTEMAIGLHYCLGTDASCFGEGIPLTNEHPDADALNGYALGRVAEPKLTDICRHLAGCGECQAVVNRVPEDAFVLQIRKYVTALPLASFGPPGAVVPSKPGANGSADTIPYVPTKSRDAEPGWPSIPGLQIKRVLGKGGMGVVYLARQASLGRDVALKVIRGADVGPEDLDRFRSEAQACGELKHTNIVQIHELGKSDGLPFVLLEYVDGTTLANKIATAPLSARQAAAITQTLAETMHFAHERGIIHRDLKPSNVLLTTHGMPKIADFGLAKRVHADAGLTVTGVILGTPSYMSPEQAGGQSAKVTPRSDVYSLGAILYELLVGRPPFKADTPVNTVMQVLADEPVPPRQLQSQVPRDLDTICLKCLDKDPAKRYDSAKSLAEDLQRFRKGLPITARRTSTLERGVKWAKRKPAAASLAGVSVAAALLLSVFGFVAWRINEHRNANAAKIAQVEAETAASVERLVQTSRDRRRAGRQAPLNGIEPLYKEAVEQAKRANEQAEIGPAEEAIKQTAKAALAEAESDLADWRKDRRLLARLIELMGLPERPDFDKVFAIAKAPEKALPDRDQQFAEAFLNWGLDPDKTPITEGAALIRSRPANIGIEVIAGLDHWAYLRRSLKLKSSERLFELAAAADEPDAIRKEMRQMLMAPTLDRERLLRVAKKIDPKTEPTLTLDVLAFAFREINEADQVLDILKSAIDARPQDPLLRLCIGRVYMERGSLVFNSRLNKMMTIQMPGSEFGSPLTANWSKDIPGAVPGFLHLMGASKDIVDFQDAETNFDVLRALRPESQLLLATARMFTHRRDDGIKMVQEMQRERKDDPLLQSILATGMMMQGKVDDLMPLLKGAEVVGGEPVKIVRILLEAQQAFSTNEWKKAEDLSREVLRSSKDRKALATAYMVLGAALTKQDRKVEALKAFAEVSRLTQDIPSGHVFMAQNCKDDKLAGVILEQGSQDDADNAVLLLYYYDYLCQHGRARDEVTLKILKDLRKAKLPDDARSLLRFGVSAFQIGEFALAEKALREVIAADPNNPAGNGNLAIVLNQVERFSEAEKYAAKAIQFGGGDEKAHYLRGYALYRLKRWREAEESLGFAFTKNPSVPEYCLVLGDTLYQLKRLDQSENVLRKAVGLHPQHRELHACFAKILRAQGNEAEAKMIEEKAMKLKSNSKSGS